MLRTLFFFFPAVGCGDPGTPTNGQRSLSSTTYNSVVTYTCDVGYTLQGANSRTCQSDGQWSGSVPQCNRTLSCVLLLGKCYNLRSSLNLTAIDCGNPGTPQNGYRELPSTTLSSQVTYHCLQGYVLVGDGTRECLESGLWSGSLPVCECESTQVLSFLDCCEDQSHSSPFRQFNVFHKEPNMLKCIISSTEHV